jgi:hypothetical protein
MAEAVTANHHEIRSQSRTLSVLFLVVSIAMAASLVGGHVVWPIVRVAGGAIEGEPWRVVVSEVGLNLIRALPAVLLLLGVLAAQRVFRRMSRGAIFTAANAADVRRIGENMLWAAIAAIVITPTLSGWVRHDTTIAVDAQDWALLLGVLGAAVGLMGRVLGLANSIKAENDEIV